MLSMQLLDKGYDDCQRPFGKYRGSALPPIVDRFVNPWPGDNFRELYDYRYNIDTIWK